MDTLRHAKKKLENMRSEIRKKHALVIQLKRGNNPYELVERNITIVQASIARQIEIVERLEFEMMEGV